MNTIVVKPVSLLRRLGAMLYDTMLIGATVFIMGGIINTIVSQLLGLPEIPPRSTLANLLFLLEVGMIYGLLAWFWTHGGQTLGMRAWKIKVVTFENNPLNWQQATMRFIVSLASLAALGAGFMIALFDPEKLTWHDRYSRTKLISAPR
ncbi:MAG: RDD family protein [Thiofilum sp.]|uniref:RDD family protein n=1 Tax=Thiofilum sp. TaxID=2212733 RepID=UPI0025F73DE3|nr:RDD family protein [Thiofilum sp.]